MNNQQLSEKVCPTANPAAVQLLVSNASSLLVPLVSLQINPFYSWNYNYAYIPQVTSNQMNQNSLFNLFQMPSPAWYFQPYVSVQIFKNPNHSSLMQQNLDETPPPLFQTIPSPEFDSVNPLSIQRNEKTDKNQNIEERPIIKDHITTNISIENQPGQFEIKQSNNYFPNSTTNPFLITHLSIESEYKRPTKRRIPKINFQIERKNSIRKTRRKSQNQVLEDFQPRSLLEKSVNGQTIPKLRTVA